MQTAYILLITALQFLTVVSSSPNLPQSVRDSAIAIGNQAITVAKEEMAKQSITTTQISNTDISNIQTVVTTPVVPNPTPEPTPVLGATTPAPVIKLYNLGFSQADCKLDKCFLDKIRYTYRSNGTPVLDSVVNLTTNSQGVYENAISPNVISNKDSKLVFISTSNNPVIIFKENEGFYTNPIRFTLTTDRDVTMTLEIDRLTGDIKEF